MNSMKIEIKELNKALKQIEGYVIPFALKGWDKFKLMICNYIFRILDYKHRKELYFKQIKDVVEAFEEEISIIIENTHPKAYGYPNRIFIPHRNCFFNDGTRAFILAHEFMHIVHDTIEDTQDLELDYKEAVVNSGAFFLLKHFDLIDASNIYSVIASINVHRMELKKQTFKKALEIGYICAKKAIQNYEETKEVRKFYDKFIK